MTRLLVLVGWAMTAIAAFLFGVILEHEEGHPDQWTVDLER